MNVLKVQIGEKIEDSLTRFKETSSFFSIAKFMSENKDNLRFWSAQPSIFDVAVQSNTSPSTVTRYAQELGLSGFKELGTVMQNQGTPNNKGAWWEVEPPGFVQHDFWVDGLIDPTAALNLPTLKNIHQDLTQKDRIYFFGFERLGHLLQATINPLRQKGYEVFTSQDYQQQLVYIEALTSTDIAIVLPFTSAEISYDKILQRIGLQETALILITKNWLNFELAFIKQKYLLRISGIEDRYFRDGTNEATILFLLKLVTETLPPRNSSTF